MQSIRHFLRVVRALPLLTASTCFADDIEQRAGVIMETLRGIEMVAEDFYGAAAARLEADPSDADAIEFVANSSMSSGGPPYYNALFKVRALLMAEDSYSSSQMASLRSDFQAWDDWTLEYTEVRIVLWSSAYLLAETFSGGTWNWGGESLTSAELRMVAKDALIAYGQSVYDRGYSEFLSPNYDPYKITAWMNLYDYAEDPEVRTIADAMLTYHFTLLALGSFNEVPLAPYSRVPGTIPDTNIGVNSQWIHWLFWGMGGTAVSNRVKADNPAFILALTDWRPPEVVDWIATGAMETPYPFFTSQPFFFAGDARHMVRTSYRTDTYAISSGVYRMDMSNMNVYGHRQMFFDDPFGITWSSTANISLLSVMHPYWDSSNWGGIEDWNQRHSPFMQVVQHENTAIVAFDIPTEDPWIDYPIYWNEYPFPANRAGIRAETPLPVAAIRYPLAQLDYSASWGDDWVSLTFGETYIAVKILKPNWRRTGRRSGLAQLGFDALVSEGTPGERWQTGFVFVCGNTSDYATAGDFMAAVMAQPVVVDWEANTIAYTTPFGNSLFMAYNNSTTIPDFSVPSFSVDGVAVDYSVWPRLESPWTSLDGTLLEIINTVDQNRYVVDWTGDIPVLETRELVQADTWAGYPVGDDGWVDTGTFMGWIYPVEPYVYVQTLGKYIYLPEAFVLEGGAWAWVP